MANIQLWTKMLALLVNMSKKRCEYKSVSPFELLFKTITKIQCFIQVKQLKVERGLNYEINIFL